LLITQQKTYRRFNVESKRQIGVEIIILILIQHQFDDSLLAGEYLLFKSKVFLKNIFSAQILFALTVYIYIYTHTHIICIFCEIFYFIFYFNKFNKFLKKIRKAIVMLKQCHILK